ncbi:MAG: hypothetical protein GY861_27920 [bacterium]|nr:hypothetical protein [bacterium]
MVNATIEFKKDKIPSGNVLVLAGVKKNRKGYLYKNPGIEKFQVNMAGKLRAQLKDVGIKLDKDKWYSILMVFLIQKNGYKRRDASNMLKVCEDAVVRATGVDDSRHARVTAHKRISPDESEYVILLMKELTEKDLQFTGAKGEFSF